MKSLNFAAGFLAALQRLWNGMLRARVSPVACISGSDARSICLDAKLLGSAAWHQVEFSVQWPFLSLPRTRRICARSLPPTGSDPEEPGGSSVEQMHAGRRTSIVRIRLSAPLVRRRKAVRLQINDARERVLQILDLEVLDASSAQQLAVNSLKVEDQRLWIQHGTRLDCGDLVANTSDFLIPEFTIPCAELCAFELRSEACLSLSLLTANDRIRLMDRPVTLSGTSLQVKGPPISIQDKSLFPHTGYYCVVASLAQRDIARFPFRIVGKDELLQQVRVTRIRLDAETRNGRSLRGARTLRWHEHEAFQLSLWIESSIRAPNSAFRCSARILQEGKLLWREEFVLSLNLLSQEVQLRRIDLKNLEMVIKQKLTRLSLIITVGEEQKQDSSILILPPERISNFEGQLFFDADDLVLDEAEYRQIINRLGVAIQPPPRRWFWKRKRRRRSRA